MSYNSTTGVISATGGISITDIKNALGVTGKSSLMQVFATALDENKVNVKSKHIPVPFPKFTGITEDERRSTNYGHSYEMKHSILDAANSFHDASFFPYIAPSSGVEAPIRMGDFRGYEKVSADWFPLSPVEFSVSKGATLRLSFDNWEELFQLGSLSWYNNIRNTGLEFGFICSQSPFTGTHTSVYWLQCTDIDGIGGIDDWLNAVDGFRIYTSNVPVGTWYMIPAFINLLDKNIASGSFATLKGYEGIYNVMLFPYATPIKMVVSAASSGEIPYEGDVTAYVASMMWSVSDPVNLVYEISHLAIGFANSGKSEVSIGYSAVLGDYTESGRINVPGGSESKASLVNYYKGDNLFLTLENGEDTMIAVTYWDTSNPSARVTVSLRMENNFTPL